MSRYTRHFFFFTCSHEISDAGSSSTQGRLIGVSWCNVSNAVRLGLGHKTPIFGLKVSALVATNLVGDVERSR